MAPVGQDLALDDDETLVPLGCRGDARRTAAAPLEVDRHPRPLLRGPIRGVHDGVDDVAVVERLLGCPALVDGGEHVGEHIDITQLGHLVADREEPAGRGLGLLCDVAAPATGREHLEPGPQEVVHPDRAMRARDFVAQVHPAAERPADLELADGAGLEADERDGVVLIRDRMDQRVGVTQHLDRPIPLADEVADDLDAVAAKVDDRAAARQPAIPEPGRMGSRVGLTRADPRDVADRALGRRLDRLERLRRVTQVLEVATEDARRLYRRQHPAGFLGRASERLRAQDGLARGRRQPDRLLVQEVGQGDHDHIGVRMVDRGGQIGHVFGDVPSLAERGAARLAARVDDAHAIAAALAVQRVRVEIADQPGTEHGDAVAVHGCLL